MPNATAPNDEIDNESMTIKEASALAQRWTKFNFSYARYNKPKTPRKRKSNRLSTAAEVAEVPERHKSRLAVMHSSARTDWATPDYVFHPLNAEFQFDLDPCCKPETAKCDQFFTPLDDGLSRSWKDRTVWMNPPYGRGMTNIWMDKACQSAWHEGATVVCLVPVQASSKWFKKAIQSCDEVRIVDGRVKFVGAEDDAPFASAIFVFRRYSPNRLKVIDE